VAIAAVRCTMRQGPPIGHLGPLAKIPTNAALAWALEFVWLAVPAPCNCESHWVYKGHCVRYHLLALDINPSVFQALQYVREDERYDSKKA